jgi:hypothetical protein
MTVHTQIWSECGQCGWSQGIDIQIISASIDAPDPAALATLNVEAYFGDRNLNLGKVATLVHRHVCPKGHDECHIPSRGGCQHGAKDCPAAKVPALYEASSPVLSITNI